MPQKAAIFFNDIKFQIFNLVIICKYSVIFPIVGRRTLNNSPCELVTTPLQTRAKCTLKKKRNRKTVRET